MTIAAGMAALLLQRGCPPDKLDEAVLLLDNWSPDNMAETLSAYDQVVAIVSDGAR